MKKFLLALIIIGLPLSAQEKDTFWEKTKKTYKKYQYIIIPTIAITSIIAYALYVHNINIKKIASLESKKTQFGSENRRLISDSKKPITVKIPIDNKELINKITSNIPCNIKASSSFSEEFITLIIPANNKQLINGITANVPCNVEIKNKCYQYDPEKTKELTNIILNNGHLQIQSQSTIESTKQLNLKINPKLIDKETFSLSGSVEASLSENIPQKIVLNGNAKLTLRNAYCEKLDALLTDNSIVALSNLKINDLSLSLKNDSRAEIHNSYANNVNYELKDNSKLFAKTLYVQNSSIIETFGKSIVKISKTGKKIWGKSHDASVIYMDEQPYKEINIVSTNQQKAV